MSTARLFWIVAPLLLASCVTTRNYPMTVTGVGAPAVLDPLVSCAQQRGLQAQRVDEEVQVHYSDSVRIAFRLKNEQHIDMLIGRRPGPAQELAEQMGENSKQRGEELFNCAHDMALEWQAQAARAQPQAQPGYAPSAGQPPYAQQAALPPEQRGPQCSRLATCYVDLVQVLCKDGANRCPHAQAFQVRTGMNELACQQTIQTLPMAIGPIREHRPDFVMPGTCMADATGAAPGPHP